jgi:hypothetical protein
MLDPCRVRVKVMLTKQLLLSVVVVVELRYDYTYRIERCFGVVSGCSW